jgi:hypothetical protein
MGPLQCKNMANHRAAPWVVGGGGGVSGRCRASGYEGQAVDICEGVAVSRHTAGWFGKYRRSGEGRGRGSEVESRGK